MGLFVAFCLQERVLRCHEAIQAMDLMPVAPKTARRGRASSVSSAPRSPTGVLDAACLSCRSDGTTTAASSPASSAFDSSPVCSKRRKISR